MSIGQDAGVIRLVDSFFGGFGGSHWSNVAAFWQGTTVIYGYARVSTSEQETALQIDALRRAGARRIVQEKTSSVGARPALRYLLGILKPTDQLVVYKLDRLARSLKDLLNIVEHLESIGCAFKSLTEPIDTGSAAGRLMLQIVGAFAEFERSLIRERSIAGQRAAVLRGARVGRPRALGPADEADLVKCYGSGFYTQAMLADVFGVDVASVKRAVYRATAA